MYNSKIFIFVAAIIAVSAAQCSPRTYTVRLSNSGPKATTIPIINKHLRTSTVERLPLRTTGCIPRPKTIDHVCTCYKTIVKPQVNNHLITVPSVQRIIQTAAAPVIEKIHYEATPVDPPCIPATAFSSLTPVTGLPQLSLSGLTSLSIPSCVLSPNTIGCGCRTACQPPAPPPLPSAPCPPVVPIALDNCGPNPCPLPPINAPPIQTPLVEKGPITLPACVPPPKTYANTCQCVKTVVKPQVVQQLITVPSVQRYIQTTHTPVVEHIHYQGIPVNCPPYAPEAPAPAAPCSAPSLPPAAPAVPPALPPCLPAASPSLPPCVPAAPPALPPCLPALLQALSPCLPVPPCPALAPLPILPQAPCCPFPRLPLSPLLLNLLKAFSSSPCLQSLLRK